MNQQNFDAFTKQLNHGNSMTRNSFRQYVGSVKQQTGIDFTGYHYKNKAEYDSLLANGIKKNNWLGKIIIYRGIALNEKYQNNQEKELTAFIKSLTHNFPQMLFISLPFLALVLKLLYIRQKNFYYVSHAIFVIDFYIFVFIAMPLGMGVYGLENLTGWKWLNPINWLISITVFYYLYKAMMNFYQQKRAKTILKYFLLFLPFLFITFFLFVICFFVSFFQV